MFDAIRSNGIPSDSPAAVVVEVLPMPHIQEGYVRLRMSLELVPEHQVITYLTIPELEDLTTQLLDARDHVQRAR